MVKVKLMLAAVWRSFLEGGAHRLHQPPVEQLHQTQQREG